MEPRPAGRHLTGVADDRCRPLPVLRRALRRSWRRGLPAVRGESPEGRQSAACRPGRALWQRRVRRAVAAHAAWRRRARGPRGPCCGRGSRHRPRRIVGGAEHHCERRCRLLRRRRPLHSTLGRLRHDVQPQALCSAIDLVRAADQALSSAKNAGGNQPSCWTSSTLQRHRLIDRGAAMPDELRCCRPLESCRGRGGVRHRVSSSGSLAQGGSPATRDLQQREFLEHRHRRQGRDPDLQCRRRANAGLCGRRGDEQDHAGRHLRSAGSGRAGQGAERRARDRDRAGLRGVGVQGLARHRGHLRADLHPQGRQPLPGGRVGHGTARCPGRHHRLPADRHRQHGAQARRRGAAQGGRAAERDLQQRQLLEHRHRREGRDPDLQRRRRAHAGLRGRRRDEQDHAGRHLRSAGSDRARQGAERRARDRRSRRASRRWCSRPRAASRTSTS